MTTIVEEKYKVLAPESMQETFMTDSEDEGAEENVGENSYKYLTVDEMRSLGDDSMPIDVTHDEKQQLRDANHVKVKKNAVNAAAAAAAAASALTYHPGIEEKLASMEKHRDDVHLNLSPDNVNVTKPPVSIGTGATNNSHLSLATSVENRSITSMWRERFLVSFMVDARGGAMRGCRHSGIRVIIPPRKASMPMRITCRYLRKDKLIHPPPLMEGEAIASRVLELGPSAAKFLGPVIIEVPHFASLRGKEREIVILRSDNGETWREHTLEATEDAVQEVLQESFDPEEMGQLDDLNTNRITRILTTDFPQYFAIVSRVRQEVHAIGPEGGVVNSSVVPQVQAIFPQGALTKKIKVGLQAQPIPPELAAKLLGNRVAVSPIVTVEPRRRKFHKPITLTIPVPTAAGKGMINQYSGDTPTLRLLCSITGGTTRAQWEDVTNSTPLMFANDCVSFTTTVSARFWLMDCRNIEEATKMATELYREAIHVPFMAKFLVFSKRHEVLEARMRVFCMTDDKEDKTLECQEHFVEVAKSIDVEVLEGKSYFMEFGGNLVPVTKSGDQLHLKFLAFRENRLPVVVKVKDPHSELMGRIAFTKEAKGRGADIPHTPICSLNVALPENVTPEVAEAHADGELRSKFSFLRQAGYGKFDTIHRADLRISDIGNLLGSDWVGVARELTIPESDINMVKSEYPDNENQQAMVMLRLWINTCGDRATGNALEKALRKCDREDIVNKCIFNVELVTDELEQSAAKAALLEDQSGFDAFKAELGPSRNSTLRRVEEDDAEVEEKLEKREEPAPATVVSQEITNLSLENQEDKMEQRIVAEEVNEEVTKIIGKQFTSLIAAEPKERLQSSSSSSSSSTEGHRQSFSAEKDIEQDIVDNGCQDDSFSSPVVAAKEHRESVIAHHVQLNEDYVEVLKSEDKLVDNVRQDFESFTYSSSEQHHHEFPTTVTEEFVSFAACQQSEQDNAKGEPELKSEFEQEVEKSMVDHGHRDEQAVCEMVVAEHQDQEEEEEDDDETSEKVVITPPPSPMVFSFFLGVPNPSHCLEEEAAICLTQYQKSRQAESGTSSSSSSSSTRSSQEDLEKASAPVPKVVIVTTATDEDVQDVHTSLEEDVVFGGYETKSREESLVSDTSSEAVATGKTVQVMDNSINEDTTSPQQHDRPLLEERRSASPSSSSSSSSSSSRDDLKASLPVVLQTEAHSAVDATVDYAHEVDIPIKEAEVQYHVEEQPNEEKIVSSSISSSTSSSEEDLPEVLKTRPLFPDTTVEDVQELDASTKEVEIQARYKTSHEEKGPSSSSSTSSHEDLKAASPVVKTELPPNATVTKDVQDVADDSTDAAAAAVQRAESRKDETRRSSSSSSTSSTQEQQSDKAASPVITEMGTPLIVTTVEEDVQDEIVETTQEFDAQLVRDEIVVETTQQLEEQQTRDETVEANRQLDEQLIEGRGMSAGIQHAQSSSYDESSSYQHSSSASKVAEHGQQDVASTSSSSKSSLASSSSTSSMVEEEREGARALRMAEEELMSELVVHDDEPEDKGASSSD